MSAHRAVSRSSVMMATNSRSQIADAISMQLCPDILTADQIRLDQWREANVPNDVNEDDAHEYAEHNRLRVLYPGKYVVYRDDHRDDNGQPRLISRTIFFVTDSILDANRLFDQAKSQGIDHLDLSYVDSQNSVMGIL
jgi:hypothetical protein